MGIGIGIFLIAVGAVLAFAVDLNIGGLDLDAVGWILMISGVGGIILFFTFWNRSKTPQPAPIEEQLPATEQQPTYHAPTPPQPVTLTTTMPIPTTPPLAAATTVTATAPVPATSRTSRNRG